MRFTYSSSKIARARGGEDGSALIPALMVVSMLAMMGLSMLSAGIHGSRVVTGQSDDYRLTSAVESVGSLTADHIWSGYLRAQGGAAGTIETFRNYLTSINVTNSTASGAPGAHDGLDMLSAVGVPSGNGHSEFDDVKVEGLQVVRQDDGEATRLYVTVSASANRGKGLVNPVLNRAVQLVYTIEPAPFEGFDYGILTKNVNCVFCHTTVDSADRVYNHDPSLYGTFAKVKVGTLESLMLRSDARPSVGDWDADSIVAGSLYVRGHATNANGVPINNWGGTLAFKSTTFDENGHLVQNSNGGLALSTFSPAGTPPEAGENLYLNYATDYNQMVDGKLPQEFPPPFPDDGGVDPTTGAHSTAGAGNKKVDPNEFYAATQTAEGTISAFNVTIVDGSQPIDSPEELAAAFDLENNGSFNTPQHGSVVLTGTIDKPIVIDGTIAIDGDVVITGYVKGKGVILASGNIYVPSDLRYLDGHVYQEGDEPGHPTGPVTFGVAQDGTKNALGLACGGNMLLGDYLAPSSSLGADALATVTGNSDSDWNFSLAEISLFNRTEWAHTQPFLPGYGQDNTDPSTWTVPNPGYVAGYVPRYYQFADGTEIPIYNKGQIYFDPATGTWRGDAEVPLAWDESQLTILDPANTSEPLLYDPVTGQPKATLLQLNPKAGWIGESSLESAIESLTQQHPSGKPVQIDGLLYTNNAIFGVVPREGRMKGQMVVNGSLVCADLGLLAPGYKAHQTLQPPNGTGSTSPYKVGLQLNYDKRTKTMLNVKNPYSVQIKRALWNPMVNVL